jgi:hypothetical protein
VSEFERLELSTETLRELTHEELGQVAGGTVGGIGYATTFTQGVQITLLIATQVAGFVTDQVESRVCA